MLDLTRYMLHERASPTRRRWGVIAAARRGEVAGDCGGGAEGTIDVVLAGAERRLPFFSACGRRGCGVSVNA